MCPSGEAILACVALAWAGCDGQRALKVAFRDAGATLPTDPATGGTAAGPCPPGQSPRVKRLDTPIKLDLLFLIDDSPSMQEEQANLARNFPRLIDELEKLPAGFPDLHLGVVSSTMGAGTWQTEGACGRSQSKGGALQVQEGCGLDVQNGHFLIAPADGSPNNFQGDISEAFACLAKLGTRGCGYEHQLQSVRMALSGFVSGNAGFLRSDAHLAVVYITDEDDCSAPADSPMFETRVKGQDGSLRCPLAGHQCSGAPVPAEVFSTPLGNCSAAVNGGGKLLPVQTFVDEMRLLRTLSVSVSVIGGWPSDPASANYVLEYDATVDGSLGSMPICDSANGAAAVGLRFKQLVDAFGPTGKIISICQDDFSEAMVQIGELINTTVVCE
ncbi:MAG: hypothetical protein JXP73_18660 [Deltaproteobacteria bacterium]|nr:hypothetical protein [Deltaproteobacteria bacterium]